ncbi:hypothetical protein PHMEG_00014827, partial [Phytophthora megakarya]
MATACTFTCDEDKQLVQRVGSYANEGSRVVWIDVTRRMGPTRHTMAGLQRRLHTLKKTASSLLFANHVAGRQQSQDGFAAKPKPLMNIEEVVTTIFDDVPRGIFIQNGSYPHQNAGELMPAG